MKYTFLLVSAKKSSPFRNVCFVGQPMILSKLFSEYSVYGIAKGPMEDWVDMRARMNVPLK